MTHTHAHNLLHWNHIINGVCDLFSIINVGVILSRSLFLIILHAFYSPAFLSKYIRSNSLTGQWTIMTWSNQRTNTHFYYNNFWKPELLVVTCVYLRNALIHIIICMFSSFITIEFMKCVRCTSVIIAEEIIFGCTSFHT